jgi:hypothetical protein
LTSRNKATKNGKHKGHLKRWWTAAQEQREPVLRRNIHCTEAFKDQYQSRQELCWSTGSRGSSTWQHGRPLQHHYFLGSFPSQRGL